MYRIFDLAWTQRTDGVSSRPDEGSVQADFRVLPSLFKPRARLEAEILILRQQINVLRWPAPKRRHLNIPIVFCLFGFITGSPPSLARSRLSGRRPSFAGIALGFERIGFSETTGRPNPEPSCRRPEMAPDWAYLGRHHEQIHRRNAIRQPAPLAGPDETLISSAHGCAEKSSSPGTAVLSCAPYTWRRWSAQYRCRA